MGYIPSAPVNGGKKKIVKHIKCKYAHKTLSFHFKLGLAKQMVNPYTVLLWCTVFFGMHRVNTEIVIIPSVKNLHKNVRLRTNNSNTEI